MDRCLRGSVFGRPVRRLVPLACWALWAGMAGAAAAATELPDEVAERQRLEALVETRLEAEATRRVDRRAQAVSLGLGWPVKPPVMSLSEVFQEARARIAAALEKRLPEKAWARFVEEARETYELHKLGDSIRLVLRGGLGPHSLLTGRLRAVTPERIRVGSRWVLRSDIAEEDQARLYPEVSEEAQQRYVRAQNVRYDLARQRYQAELERAVIPSACRDGGYVPRDEAAVASLRPEDWVSAHDLLESRCREVMRIEKEKLRTAVEEQVYSANGYEYDEELGRWVRQAKGSAKSPLGSRIKRLWQF